MNEKDIKLPSNKKFGLFFTFIFLIFSSYSFWKNNFYVGLILLLLGLTIFFITIINSKKLTLLNKLWMKLGIILGSIVNPIILGILFFGMFFPLGCIMRLLGRDELNLKLGKNTSSWNYKISNIQHNNNFNQQF